MIKLLTVVGARPQFIKAASISRCLRRYYAGVVVEFLLHTGQHYDANMSEVFFKELELPEPDKNLGVGSLAHGGQTALMMSGIEEVIMGEHPAAVILFGDTNSTLAGAMAAAKQHIPVVHIEAGLRSFDKTMPEEINRLVCDHVSTLLFAPTDTAIKNLAGEGFPASSWPPYTINNPGIFQYGDVMFDSCLYYLEKAQCQSKLMQKYDLIPDQYLLATIHREHNTDHPERLASIFEALHIISSSHQIPVVIPMHPRTSKLLHQSLGSYLFQSIHKSDLMVFLPPVPYMDMLVLEKNAKMVLTDSGGVQKEAWFFHKPVVVLRAESEWKEIIDNKAGLLADANTKDIVGAVEHFSNWPPMSFPPLFGDGHATEKICEDLVNFVKGSL